MNKKRRESLGEAMTLLSKASTIVESVCDKEEECVDNYPENLQGSDVFEAMENAVDSLNEAVEKIGEAKEYIQCAI